MSFANKHNKANANAFSYQQIEGAPYIKAADLFQSGNSDEGTAVRVRGCFINEKSRFGTSASLICEGCNINVPSHMTKDIESILQDPNDIHAINAGMVGVYAYEYVNSRGGKSYGLRWVDLPGDAQAAAIDSKDLPY